VITVDVVVPNPFPREQKQSAAQPVGLTLEKRLLLHYSCGTVLDFHPGVVTSFAEDRIKIQPVSCYPGQENLSASFAMQLLILAM
jgi:hypothetical protein